MAEYKLTTDWLTICTAGKTVDGRDIPESWLRDAAATYDPEMYPAFINQEHSRWGYNLGQVEELRLGKNKKGEMTLEGRLRVNKHFVLQNSEDQGLCYSCEFLKNFRESGKAYLSGLATTDFPAAVGTTPARFAANKEDIFHTDFTTPEKVTFDGKSAASITPDEEGFFRKLAKFFNIKLDQSEGEIEMTKEELSIVFAEVMKPVVEKLNTVAAGLEKLTEKPAEAAPATPPATPPKEEFSAKDAHEELSKAVAGLGSKLDEFGGKLTEALKAAPSKGGGDGTGAAGAADNSDLL